MKKNKILLFLTLVLLPVIAGCGKNTNPYRPVETESAVQADNSVETKTDNGVTKDSDHNKDVVYEGAEGIFGTAESKEKEDNSFQNKEFSYFKENEEISRLAAVVLNDTGLSLKFLNGYCCYVYYEGETGYLHVQLSECRCDKMDLPVTFNNGMLEEFVVAGSEEGIDAVGYVAYDFPEEIDFRFETITEEEYFEFKIDIIVP